MSHLLTSFDLKSIEIKIYDIKCFKSAEYYIIIRFYEFLSWKIKLGWYINKR